MSVWHSKYNSAIELTQQELRDISQDITDRYAPHEDQQLPELVLLAVDPNNLYAYWNLHQIQQVVDIDQTHQLCLRVYSSQDNDVIQNSIGLRFDIPVDSQQGQQKIPLPVPGISYFADMGLITDQNDFEIISTSNTVHIPIEFPESEQKNVQQPARELQPVVNHPIKADFNLENQQLFETAQEGGRQVIVRQYKNFNELGYDLLVFNGPDTAVVSNKSGTFEEILDPTEYEKRVAQQFSGLGRLDVE